MKDMINKLIENYEFDAKDIAGAKPYMKVVSSDRVRKIFQQALKKEKEKLKGILQSIKASVDSWEEYDVIYENIEEIAKENNIIL